MDIQNGKCLQSIQGLPGLECDYSNDPVEIAKLWRRENCKCLHLVDLDGVEEGQLKNVRMIREVVQSVDIPVQLGGRLRNSEDITKALVELGVYRVVVSGETDLDLIHHLIEEHGPRKIVVSIEAKDGNHKKMSRLIELNTLTMSELKNKKPMNIGNEKKRKRSR